MAKKEVAKSKEVVKSLVIAAAMKLIENTPEIIEHVVKKKEEKNILKENKSWFFIIIFSIFVTNLEYINMFDSVILNSIINMMYGIIVLILLCLFYYEEKNIFKVNSWFIRVLIVSLTILGIINSLYHICFAVSNFFTLVL